MVEPRQRGIELPTLALVALVTIGLWAFVIVAGVVANGDPLQLDEYLLLQLRSPGDPTRPIGPEWLPGVSRDFTALGSIAVLSFVTVTVSLLLLLQRSTRPALFLLATVGSGMLLSSLMKLGFDRARPDLVPHGATVFSASFPSGHALISAVAYLTFGALLARSTPHLRSKIFVLAAATLLTLLAGTSRVYLGVHWPSDVLGGWALGAAWASLCLLLGRRLRWLP
jgi:undecaprenyl-diphosphatase